MTDITTSAREYRAAARDSQLISAHLQLIHRVTALIAKQGASEPTLQKTIELICNFSNAEHGLIALDVAGSYKIKASIGAALTTGTRVPASIMANINLTALSSINHSNQACRLWGNTPVALTTQWIIPVKVSMQVVGFIALSSQETLPEFSEQEHALMMSLATIVGLCTNSTRHEPSQEVMMALNLLTPREKDVFKLLPSGLTNAEIGTKLGIATGTAKIHVERILSKLDLNDRTQAAVRANELGYHLE